jgi:hypothetical protein
MAVGSFGSHRKWWPMAAVCGLAAVLPDVDFLLPVAHRGPTHSLLAGFATGIAAFVVMSAMSGKVAGRRIALLLALAVLSHVLLDWLGQDSSTPRGVMALWPFNTHYYISDVNVFKAVDRRYWLPGFWRRNLIAVARELLILVPVLVIAVRINTRRSPGRTSGQGDQPPPSA